MSGFARAVVLLLSLSGLCAWSGEAEAIAKFARIAGSWGTAGTWSSVSCAAAGATTVPTAADDVTICPGVAVVMNGNPGSALSLVINGTANWTQARTTNVGAGGITINAGGDITGTANGVLTSTGGLTINAALTSTTVTITLQTTAAQTINGTGSLARLTVTGAGVTATNIGTLTVGTALAGTGTLANTAILNIGGTATITGLTANAVNNVVNYYAAGAQTLKQATYYNLSLSGSGTKSSGAITLQVDGTTTVTGTATFNISSTTGTKTFVGPVIVDANCSWTNTANEPVTFRGGITHNGTTFSSGTGLQTFDINSQTLAGASAMTFGGAVTVTGAAITLTNNNSNTVTITGTLNGTAAGSTFVNGANAMLNYGAAVAPMVTGVLDAGTNPNTVNYTRAGAQTVRMPSGSAYHHLTLSGSGIKTMPAGAMTVGGNFTLAGTATTTATGAMTVNGNFTVGTGTTFNAGLLFAHGIKGDFSNSGTFTASTSTVTLDGAAAQTIGGTVATTFYGLTVNNAAGVSLSGVNATASNLLTLQSGVVTTGAQILVASTDCTTGIARTSGHVAGNLQLRFPTGTPSCTFHVGDASAGAYRPIGMTFASVTTAGNLTGTQTAGEHQNIATSGLDSAADVNHNWTLTNPAGGTIAFTTYTATFNFISGDIDIDADTAKFEIERWDGSAWSNTTLGTPGTNSTSASGLPSFAAGISNSFAVGEKKPPFVVSIVLASADPTSPATSVDWTVTFNSPVTEVDSADFALVMGGSVSGASITGVAIVGGPTWSTTWTVTASTGVGAGTLGLNLVDNDTIVNAAPKPLGGAGAGNGNFTGQVYTVVYTASGFVFTNSACTHNVPFGVGQPCTPFTWSPQVAGLNSASVYITSINTSGVPTRLHASLDRTRNMEFRLICNDSNPAHEKQVVFAGATLPFCHLTTWSSPVTVVTFPGGSPSSNVPYTFNYADVGSVELLMRNNLISTETGNSGAFVVKPGGFLLAATCADATVNAASQVSPSTGDPKFCRAGQGFNATVTAITQAGNPTPNYGKESAPETVAVVWSRQLPASGADGTLPSGSLPFAGSGGVFGPPVSPFTWDEVGILKADLAVGDGDYLGAGNVSGTAYVGRFYPDHFDVAITPQCSGFIYAGRGATATPGQPFTVMAVAMSGDASPNPTANYNVAAGFSKDVNLTLTAGGTGVGDIYVDSAPGSTAEIPAAKFVAGGIGQVNYGDVSGKISYVFDTFPTSATAIALHADDADTVAGTPLIAGTDGTVSARSGRLRLSNAYGSELLPLRVPVQAEYFNVANWELNVADTSCTVVPVGAVAIGNVKPPASSLAPTASLPVTLSGGRSIVILTQGATKHAGSVDLALNLRSGAGDDQSCVPWGTVPPTTGAGLDWLQYSWCAGKLDPSARATFGVYKGRNEFIYLREMY